MLRGFEQLRQEAEERDERTRRDLRWVAGGLFSLIAALIGIVLGFGI